MAPKTHMLKAVAEIDHAELTIRLMQIGCRIRRPIGMTGAEALADARAKMAGTSTDYIVKDFEEMAAVAVMYLTECINRMSRVQ
jgi:hypothetical protein